MLPYGRGHSQISDSDTDFAKGWSFRTEECVEILTLNTWVTKALGSEGAAVVGVTLV